MSEHRSSAHGHGPDSHGKDGHSDTYDLELNIKVMVWTGVWLAAGIVVSMAAMWLFSVVLQRMQVKADLPASPIPEAAEHVLPPTPRLQAKPETELDAFLSQQRQALTTYGWVSKEGGVAHIPVERAIEIMVERGLPASAPTSQVITFPPAAEHAPAAPTATTAAPAGH